MNAWLEQKLADRLEHAYWCDRCDRDPEYRAAFLAACKADPVFFINNCLWTFDPRLEGAARFIPFLLFEQQEAFVRELRAAMEGNQDILVDKSRDTGASWCALATIFHAWYFEPAFLALLGSRKEDLVDKANEPACLMWKLDELYRSLPEWMKIPGYTPTKPHRTHLIMANPRNGSIVSGESANPNFGRGGRYKVILCDEAAFWDNMRAAYTSCGESTKSRWLVSTPNGMNFFGRLANPKKAKKGERQSGPRKMSLHWSLDPRHVVTELDQNPQSPTFGQIINPWLEEQRAKYAYDPEMMAQELDIDYRSSVKGRYYPQIDFSRLGLFPYEPTLPLYTAWDFGVSDSTAILWAQWHAPSLRWRVIDAYQNRGKSIAFYVPFVTGLQPGDPLGETYTRYDLDSIKRHQGWRYAAHFGDPAGRNVTQTTNTSVIDELALSRIYVTYNTNQNEHRHRRDSTKKLLLRLDIDEEHCDEFLDAIRNSKYPERPDGHQNTSVNNKPVHDENSHYRSALEYLAVNDPHRNEHEDRREGINVSRGAGSVGAVFGGKDRELYAAPGDAYDPWDEDQGSEGRGKAGY